MVFCRGTYVILSTINVINALNICLFVEMGENAKRFCVCNASECAGFSSPLCCFENAKRKSLNNAKLFTTHTHTHARSQPDINSPRNVSVVKRIGKRFMHNRNSGNRIRDILMIFQPKLNGLLFSFRLIPRYMSLEMSPCVALFGLE